MGVAEDSAHSGQGLKQAPIMRFQRRETLALGELVLFVATWLLAMSTTLDDYYNHSSTQDNIAAVGESAGDRQIAD